MEGVAPDFLCSGVAELNALINLATVALLAYATRSIRSALQEARAEIHQELPDARG